MPKNLATMISTIALTLSALTSTPLLAQDDPIDDPDAPVGSGAAPPPYPSDHYAISPGGVDMRTGQLTYNKTDLTIGGSAGVSLIRHAGSENHASKKPFGNFSHNWEVYMLTRVVDREQSVTNYIVSGGSGRSTSFTGRTINAWASQASPGPLTSMTAVNPRGPARYWIYTAPDGTKITFRPIDNSKDCKKETTSGVAAPVATTVRCAYGSEILEPDGTKYTLSYDNPNPNSSNGARLRRVVSNRGFALLFEYYGYSDGNNVVKEACVLNLATDLLPSNNICPAGAPTSTYTYSGNGALASATNALGHTFEYTSTRASAISKTAYKVHFYLPGDSQAYLTNDMEFQAGSLVVAKQSFSDGRDYTYTWKVHDYDDAGTQDIAGGFYQLNNDPAVEIRYGLLDKPGPTINSGSAISPGPVFIKDELSRSSTSNYCQQNTGGGGGCIIVPARYWYYPDGRQLELKYDPYHRHVIERRWKAKAGSGLSDIVTSTDFGPCGANPLLCNKPIQTTNARRFSTDYTYDSQHGGVTSVTSPAVNGVRPTTWHRYAQKYAWIRRASGGYQRASSPIWVRISSHECISSQGTYNASTKTGSCASGSADETKTVYEYGPDSGPSNLYLRGVATVADGQTHRECYRYDDLGRKIGETLPKGNLGACP